MSKLVLSRTACSLPSTSKVGPRTSELRQVVIRAHHPSLPLPPTYRCSTSPTTNRFIGHPSRLSQPGRLASSSALASSQSSGIVSEKPIDHESDLAGTVHEHKYHLVLLTGRSSKTWPSHVESVSPLYRALCERLNGNGWAVGVSDDGPSLVVADGEWDASHSKFDPISANIASMESYDAVVYPWMVNVPFKVGMDNLDEVERWIAQLPQLSEGRTIESSVASTSAAPPSGVDIYVCTHGSRDCRCADYGEPVLRGLQSAVAELSTCSSPSSTSDSSSSASPSSPPSPPVDIRIRSISHVGGHKYAANVLVFPSGDWYGRIDPSVGDVAQLVKRVVRPAARAVAGRTVKDSDEGVWWEKWRGRMGLTKDEQIALFGARPPVAEDQVASAVEDTSESIPDEYLDFVTWDSQPRRITAKLGESLVSAAKRAELPAIEATCGGNCECATCQVYMPSEAPMPAKTEEEEDQLEFAIGRKEGGEVESRLACQIPLTRELVDWLNKEGKSIHLPRF